MEIFTKHEGRRMGEDGCEDGWGRRKKVEIKDIDFSLYPGYS